MIKAAHLSLGLAALLLYPATVPAQDTPAPVTAPAATPPTTQPAAVSAPDVSAADMAVHQSVKDQADTIVLQKNLIDARATAQRGDIINAARMYQDCVSLAEQIGPGIQTEMQEATTGLAFTCMALARDAQSRGDYHEADKRVKQVLKADPQNQSAIQFKAQNDQMLAAIAGRIPDAPTIDQAQQVAAAKISAGTLVQDGKLLYEMGKLDEAEQKLIQAGKLDPDNQGAIYYMNLIQQAKYQRSTEQHTIDTQTRMTQVEKQWVLPKANIPLPTPNPYATNSLTYTGPGRQMIIDKLNRIHLDNVNFDGLPLNEVLRQLSEQSKLRDPDRKGINFLINPNPDLSGQAVASGITGLGGFPGAPAAPAAAPPTIDPATGLPVAPGGGAGGAGGGENVDISTAVSVKLSLTDERLSDVLDAIQLVAEHPPGHQLKYTIEDFGVVFSDKGAESPQLFVRTFKVDPNTFYSGLESVGSSSFGSSSSGSGGSGGGGGSSGGGGGGSGQNNGAVIGVVNAFAGAGSLRNQGGSGGGGGGGGGGGQGAVNPLNAGQPGAGGAGGGGGGGQDQGGVNYVTQVTLAQQVSAAARTFFTTLGVNLLAPAGKAVFFNDRTGILLVKATEQDLDTIDKAIQTLNVVAPQVHIKSRFIEVQQADSKQMGFDWYLGQFNLGNNVVAQGGNPGSLIVPANAGAPIGAFPGATPAQTLADQGQQLFSSGLSSATTGATTATLTGILTNPNFQVVLHMLDQRSGTETLAEPEVVTTSGRQTQMRATQVITVITGVGFQQGQSATTTTGVSTP